MNIWTELIVSSIMLHDNSYHDGIEYLSGETYWDYFPYALSLIDFIHIFIHKHFQWEIFNPMQWRFGNTSGYTCDNG